VFIVGGCGGGLLMIGVGVLILAGVGVGKGVCASGAFGVCKSCRTMALS
jgi:hypothetical protein